MNHTPPTSSEIHAGDSAAPLEGPLGLQPHDGERSPSSSWLTDRSIALRAELLYDLADSVIRATTIEAVFDAALDGIERALGASRSAILAFDERGSMRFKAWRGLSDVYRQSVEGHSPWHRHAPHPEAIVVPDVQRDSGLSPFAELFRRERIGALGFVPLVGEGRLIGKLMVYYREPRQLSDAELAMAKAIANHVAAAMGRFSALAELQRAVRFNEIFTGMLGHDLRNPLGAIMTAAQIAVRRNHDEQLEKPLSRILSSGSRMAKMIDQLLDFTRVRVGVGIPIEARPSDAMSIVRQVIEELEDAHPTWQIRVEEAAGDPLGHWDPDRISQVFSNLVANAVQHGLVEHGVKVTVDGGQPYGVTVQVHNMGTIPEEMVPRLFDPMASASPRREKSQGLGLGLFISEQILKAHGGSLHVETSVERGTTFSARLPRDSRQGAEEPAS